MASVRDPIRPLDSSKVASAYPNELLVDFSTGNFTILNDNKNQILHKKPGSLTVKSGSVSILAATDLSETVSLDLKAILANITPKADSGNGSAGTSEYAARADHIHPLQSSVSGNAGSADKLSNPVSIGLSGVTATAVEFDGSDDVIIDVTAVPAGIVTGLHTVATSGSYIDLKDKPTYATVATSGKYGDLIGTPNLATVATSGNYTDLDGTPTLATVATSGSYDDLDDKPTIYQPAASTALPVVAGTANAGTATTFARADHVHPLQTTVSGNAGTATKLATARTIAISGAATGTATPFDGSGNISIPVTSIDGTKITGIIPLSSIPKGAQERLYITASDTTRLALTTDDVQDGDTIKVSATGMMYYVKDQTKLGTEAAFEPYSAGTASAVAWGNITGKPNFATVATSGSYNDLSNRPTVYQPSSTGDTPAAAGTASIGTKTTFARADHVHPLQTTVSGNAGTATKLASAKTFSFKGITAGSKTFDGSANVEFTVTAVPANIVTGLSAVATSGEYSDLSGTPTLATVATSGSYNDLNNKPTIYQPAGTTDTPVVAGTAAVGTKTTFARADHVHPLQTTVSGNAGTATKLATARTISFTGITAQSKTFDGSGNIEFDVTAVPANIVTGLSTVATSGSYNDLSNTPTIYQPAGTTDTPAAAGTATVGTKTTFARADHVHPLQTTVSGNAGTATKLATARTISFTGITAQSKTFDGSANVEFAVTAVPASIVTGLSTVATSGSYNDLSNTPTIYQPAGTTTVPAADSGTGSAGTATTFARADHVHPLTHISVATSTDSTSTSGPSFGGTFTAIDGVTRDSYGHVTKINTKTVTIPSTAASASSAGLLTTGTQTIAGAKTFSTSVTTPSLTVSTPGNVAGIAVVYEVTLTAAGWTGSDAPFTQTLSLSGVKSTDKGVWMDINYSGTYATDTAYEAAFANIHRAVSNTGSIVVYAHAKPEADIPVNITVVR